MGSLSLFCCGEDEQTQKDKSGAVAVIQGRGDGPGTNGMGRVWILDGNLFYVLSKSGTDGLYSEEGQGQGREQREELQSIRGGCQGGAKEWS